MRTDHATPLQEFRTVADIEWTDAKWPPWIGVTIAAVVSAVCWAAIIFGLFCLAAAIHR